MFATLFDCLLLSTYLPFRSATSDPKGPVYLWARREVMEEEVALSALDAVSGMTGWPTIERSALSASGRYFVSPCLGFES